MALPVVMNSAGATEPALIRWRGYWLSDFTASETVMMSVEHVKLR